LLQRWESIGLTVRQAEAHRAAKQSEIWIGQQVFQEMQGAPRIPDKEFQRAVDQAALKTIFPRSSKRQMGNWLDCLNSLPHAKQTWQRAPGALETLETLHSCGFRLAVASNFDETLPDLLIRLGLAPYFERIVCSALVGVEKPNPEILRIACRQMNIYPGSALYVGDHPFDVLCARQAGMPAAWLREPGDQIPDFINCQPDFEIGCLHEVTHLFL
jgi:HAD superfamily hydrolase (TIGR01549 family)